MSILKRILGRESSFEKIGNVESRCPHCQTPLEKRPARKKKCPHCGEFIYVRTRPADRNKVLVTEQQAAQVDEQWTIVHGTLNIDQEEKREFDAAKNELGKRFGSEPSDRDVWWSIYNKRLMEQASHGDWGLYRNTRLDMAELLRKEAKHKHAIDTYLEVSYLDSNGPRNLGGSFDTELLREFPMFDRSMAFQAPAVVSQIAELADKLGLPRDEIRELYITIATRTRNNLKTPTPPDQAWEDLANELDSL